VDKHAAALERAKAKTRKRPAARKRGPSMDQQRAAIIGDVGELIHEAGAPGRAAAEQARATRDLLDARIAAATNPAREMELRLQAVEIDNAAKLAQITSEITDKRAQGLAVQAQAMRVDQQRTRVLSEYQAKTEALEVAERARQMTTVQGYVAAGTAAAQGLASMMESERKRAALMAAIAAADAAVQFMRGNYPGAIAGGFAAAKYAAVALGAGAAGASAGAGRFGGGTRAEAERAPTTAAQSGPRVINVTLGGGFVVGTPQMVGKSIADAVKSLDGTGYEAAA